jgi:aspartyl-tRNA(Asn)/glutamyl-tRNA(Gln) amidotransferase subunit A
MLRSGQTTPTRLAEYFVDRLETVGRRLNAVVTITRDRALREARLAEAELATGLDRGPLHGIPYGAKDLLAAVGAPTTWGAEPLRDQVLAEDATAIARLRDAGAVLVAKLAMIELAGGMGYRQPNASFTGPCRTPWNLDAWSGGSSSGSGAAVGAGCVPFALGSETWGSIVSPSGNCGITGLRPTSGRVSRRGAMALSWSMDKIGPMARSADDCGLVLDAIAGPDPGDPSTLPSPYHYEPDRAITARFRIGVVREGLELVQPEVSANFERSLTVLRDLGAVDDVVLPDHPYTDVATIILRAEAAASMEELMERGDLAKLTAPEDRTNDFVGALLPAVDYLRAMRLRRRLTVDLDRLFARYDVLVAPSLAVVACPLAMSFDEYERGPRRLVVGSATNLAGLPGVSVPNGFGERGLPTGLQLFARAGADNIVLAAASAYQARTDWHRQVPPL